MRTLDTRAVHAGREDLVSLGVHVPPIDFSSTYPLPSVDRGGESYETLAGGGRPDPGESLVYQRLWNPGVDRFERALAELEGCAEAVAFASGMAALTAVVLAAVTAGTPHLVAIRPLVRRHRPRAGHGPAGHPGDLVRAPRAWPPACARTPVW